MDTSYEEWKAAVEGIVEAFSDIDFQRAAWIGEIATAYASPGEMMCVFFDDLDVPGFIAEYEAQLGEEGAKGGRDMVETLRGYDWPMQGQFIDAIALLMQPRWPEVCGLSKRFLGHLRNSEKKGSE